MPLTPRRAVTALAMAPLLLLPTACSKSSADAANGSASVASVTESQLKGVSISTADFFGDCSDAIGDNTDLAKAVDECSTFQTLINKFNAENKYGITVTQQGADWKSYYDSLNAAFAAKNPPNVTLMHEANIPDYSSRGLLLPLQDDYQVVGIDPSDFTDPAAQAVSIDGKTYAIPFDEHANLVHLNMDLMKKAHLVNADGSPVLPTSPAELKQQAAQFQAATGLQYMAWGNDFNIPFRIFSTFVSQQGKPVVTDDGKVQIDTPEGRNALNLIKDIYSSGIADKKQTYDASQQAWLNGKVGVLVNGTWVVNQYVNQAKFSYEATDFPTLYQQPGVWANAHTWVIPVQANGDPVKYRASLEFAAWMYQHDKEWALGSGHLSVRKSVLSSDGYKSAPQRGNYVATAQHASLVPQVVGWQGAEDDLQHAIEKVWLSSASVDSALSEAQSKVSQQLKG
ncbi:MAG: extracellular solute-binding protein [Motilibacteraceae bacterium]